MKRKTKQFRFGDWKRTTNAGGKVFFFYRGKRTSAEKFERALRRRVGSRKRKPAKKKKPTRKPPQEKPDTGYGFDLCTLKDRREFYERVVADRRELRKKLSEEDMSALRVDIDIGNATRRKNRRGEMSEQGYRRFKDLRKLKNFLGLNVKYENTPDFSRRGICQYKKTAYQVITRMRGEREIGKKILKRYVYEPF